MPTQNTNINKSTNRHKKNLQRQMQRISPGEFISMNHSRMQNVTISLTPQFNMSLNEMTQISFVRTYHSVSVKERPIRRPPAVEWCKTSLKNALYTKPVKPASTEQSLEWPSNCGESKLGWFQNHFGSWVRRKESFTFLFISYLCHVLIRCFYNWTEWEISWNILI